MIIDSPSAATTEQVIKYLAKGFRPKDIERTLGVSAGLISQIQKQEGFQEKYLEHREDDIREAEEQDSIYDAIEKMASTSILQKVKLGLYKPTELISVAMMANKATRKTAALTQENSSSSQTPFVQIILPANLPGMNIREVITNDQNQVLQAGNTKLIPPPKSLIEDMANVAGEKNKEKLPLSPEDF